MSETVAKLTRQTIVTRLVNAHCPTWSEKIPIHFAKLESSKRDQTAIQKSSFSENDTNDAVKAARNSFESWWNTPKEKKLELLNNLLKIYINRSAEMAEAISKEMGAPKLAERFELKQRFPGIDEDLLTNIIEDPDPQHKAEVIATLDETFKMMQTGKGPEEIIDILEQSKKTRKDNAQGGLNYLMGL